MSKLLKPVYIEDDSALKLLCNELSRSKVLAIDTEFVRTRTLYPILGLLQVNNGETLALIDPITIKDLSPFWDLLSNSNILKVLHACSEDLEVFLTAGKCKPVNMIDSQIMMSFLGRGISMGYAAMVSHYCDITLDKSESRTDWTKRPLTAKQLTYASADVAYLFDIYPKAAEELENKGWLQASFADTQAMIERKYTEVKTDELYQQVKMSWKLTPIQLNRLMHLAQWRYLRAQQKNVPIGFIAKDYSLFYIAQINPETLADMQNIEGVENLDVKHQGNAMLKVLAKASQSLEENYPQVIKRLDDFPGYKEAFKKVKAFIVKKSDEIGLLPENLASKKQINQFLSWHFSINQMQHHPERVDVLQTWREKHFGAELALLAHNKFVV